MICSKQVATLINRSLVKPLCCDLFRKRIDQKNFLSLQQLSGISCSMVCNIFYSKFLNIREMSRREKKSKQLRSAMLYKQSEKIFGSPQGRTELEETSWLWVFLFSGLRPQFVFTGLSLQFVFTDPGSIYIYQPWLIRTGNNKSQRLHIRG